MLSRHVFLELTRDLNWPDVEAWRTARVLSDEGGNLSLRAFMALFNEGQLVHELMRVYDIDQDGLLDPTEVETLCLEWLGVDTRGANMLMQKYSADAAVGLTTAEMQALVREGNEVAVRGLPEGVPPLPAAATAAEGEPEPEPEAPADAIAQLRMDEAAPAAATMTVRVAAWVALAEVKPSAGSDDRSNSPTDAARGSGSSSPDQLAERGKSPQLKGTCSGSLQLVGRGNGGGVSHDFENEDEDVVQALQAAMIASQAGSDAHSAMKVRAQSQSIGGKVVGNISPSMSARSTVNQVRLFSPLHRVVVGDSGDSRLAVLVA